MPAKKHPDRKQFDAEMKVIEGLGEIPTDYATIIRHSRPDLTKRHIYDVRHGYRIDLEVLSLIRKVVLDRATANVLHPQHA